MLTAALLVAMSTSQTAPSGLEVDLRSRSGLFVTWNGVPLIQGSFLQVYEPGWVRGYYSTNWNDQQIRRTSDGYEAIFRSGDGRVDGRIVLRQTGTELRADYTLAWNGATPANVEASFGHLWAPALQNGRIEIDGRATRSPLEPARPTADIPGRTFGETGQEFLFAAPVGQIRASVSGAPAYVFDARNYDQDFSRGRELFWFGVTNVPAAQGQPAQFSVVWNLQPRPVPLPAAIPVKGRTQNLERALESRESVLPMVPEPKQVESSSGRAFIWPSPGGVAQASAKPAMEFLRSRFDLSAYRPRNAGRIAASQRNLGLPAGGYRLEVRNGTLTLVGQDAEGLRNAFLRAAMLTRIENGQPVIPAMRIVDHPSVDWRGVHMFVGPRARDFQGRMMQRLLAPLLYNQVVLQCERTDWDSTPGIELGWTMSKADLRALFASYRAHGIEPTPLIQSFGHMGWLFANNQNLDIAFNPQVPFSIDPRKPRTREVLSAIWAEAVELLDPKIMHFGLDEVDMRGWPNDPKLTTEMWRMHVPFLGELAKKHGREMMIWGDKLLAPGEAPDATHGHTKADAAARRAVVPKGAWIADWHYINNANPAIYTSIELLQREGFKVAASTWNRPENIKGFFKAAEQRDAGVLQTTWAGYESTEENMLRESSQFVAYVLAGEYAWSGRSELARDLPYRPDDLLRRLMYGGNMPLRPVAGRSVEWSPTGQTSEIGNYRIARQAPLRTFFPLSEEGARQPREQTIEIPSSNARGVVLGLDVRTPLDELAEVGQIVLHFANGTQRTVPVRYGQHVRVARDTRAVLTAPRAGISAMHIRLAAGEQLTKVELRGTNPAAGLELHGITLL